MLHDDENEFNAFNGAFQLTPQKPIFSQLTATPNVSFNLGQVPHSVHAPILDDLFSELTQQQSDLGFDLGSVERRGVDCVPKSEPVDLADMERILLQPSTKKASIRQPFNSRLAAYSASVAGSSHTSLSSLSSMAPLSSMTNTMSSSMFDTDASNPFLLRPTSVANNSDVFSDIFSDPALCESSITPAQSRPLLHLQSASNIPGGKIQVKVINTGMKIQKPPVAPVKRIVPSYHAPSAMNSAQYRTYGKKRLPIGAAYADFVCRLQNDIPFDSSEEDEEEDEEYGSSANRLRRNESDDDDSDAEEESESEDQSEAKIPPQELLELFEDQCQGSASLINRKHQISIKRNLLLIAAAKRAAMSPLMSQSQFDQLQTQLSQHFQFLIQNLALSNEVEGGEAITLLSLKLLVQLHLHLDSSCNFQAQPPSLPTANSSTSTISCLKPAAPSKVNPVTSALSDLIPLGIHRVAVIAGFLARPGQKQFLSLAALRADMSLKPKSSCLPLSLRIKAHAQLNGTSGQLLSNAFYNIITLFHEFIDAKLLESTINMQQLSKHLELPSNEAFLLENRLYPQSTTNSRPAKFSPAEDALLLCGLKRFGCGNWESIQATFLPCRAAKQLAIRYKNLSSRREPMNPVKEFNERMMMPLSEIEEDLLFKGVQKFGNEFHLISQHYLPHRPATVLRKLWKAMEVND